jgi:ADP-heptose:LPS heptosyltransferase
LRSLGDTVLITPALAVLKQARPDLQLVVVLQHPFDELLEGNPHVSRVIVVEPNAGLRQRLRELRAIRGERPTLCLNLHGGATSAWLTALSGARWRAAFGHFRHGFVYNVRIPRAQQVLGRAADAPVHTAEHHASAVFYLGVPQGEVPAAVLHAAPHQRAAPYAVLHVAAAYFTKQWPAARFREIALFLAARGLEPVIVTGPGESSLLQEFSGFPCFDRLSIGELKTLLAGASLFVGNDSGPAHVAAAFSVSCVVIFGSSNSAVWHPWKTRHAVVETAWSCKPCPGDRCYAFDEPRCILSVEAAAVRTAIEIVLDASSRVRRPETGQPADDLPESAMRHKR